MKFIATLLATVAFAKKDKFYKKPERTPTAGDSGSGDISPAVVNVLDLTKASAIAAAVTSGINVATPLTVTLKQNTSTGFTFEF
jgi:hypothetical protein